MTRVYFPLRPNKALVLTTPGARQHSARAFEPLAFTSRSKGKVRVIAEIVEVLTV